MGRIIWGIILIGIGILFFGQNMGWLDMSAGEYIGRYWPVILVIFGLAVLADVFKSVLVRILILVIIIGIFCVPFILDLSQAVDRSTKISQSNVLLDGAKNLNLSVDAGAVEFNIDNKVGAKNAIEANLKSEYLTLKTQKKKQQDDLTVDLSMNNAVNNIFQYKNLKNELNLHLNDALVIKNLSIDAGASTINSDLSKFNIQKIDFNTGATTINLRLGDKNKSQSVSIDSGASTVNIEIPKEVGVQLQYEGGLSSKNLPDDFQNLAKGLSQSENYGSAENKIVFDINLGAATLNIDRY